MSRLAIHRTLLILLASMMLVPVWAQSKLPYMAMSALVPGSAELALGKTNRGIVLLASDIVAVSAYLKTSYDMDIQSKAYKKYAQHYAGVDPTMPQNHYQVVQEYFSSVDFNKFQEMMARNYFVIYLNDVEAFQNYMAVNTYEGIEAWQWQSSMHWDTYKDMRRKHQRTKINHTLALGIMLLNRAVSVLDIAIINTDGRLHASPHGPDGVLLGYELNF
ncbi:MAG: hypothetical protein LRZ88_01075 [Candidatus Cloacimonetes bacterium]|nr:hypothetical protein [Candidatus Cloacimonadota bacterium]